MLELDPRKARGGSISGLFRFISQLSDGRRLPPIFTICKAHLVLIGIASHCFFSFNLGGQIITRDKNRNMADRRRDVPPNRIPMNRWSIQAKKTEETDERVTQFCFVCWHFRLLPWFRIEFQLQAQRILRELTDFTGLFGGDQSVSTQWITVSSRY